MSSHFIDLSGKFFAEGNIEVIRRAPNPCHGTNTQAYWECRCACGNIFSAASQALRNGQKSCRQCFEVNSRVVGVATNVLLSQYRNEAKQAAREFTLTPEEFHTLVTSNCSYCGIVPSQVSTTSYEKMLYNGIDRVDSNQGYVLVNCVPCCKICNYAKHNKTKDEFLTWLKRAYEFSFGRKDAERT